MPKNDPDFEKNIKNSFLKVKEDIFSLKNQISTLNNKINQIISEISSLKPTRSQNQEEKPNSSQKSPLFEKSSIGNEGVYADIHSFIHSDIHSHPKQLNSKTSIINLKKDLKIAFKSLPKQAFLTFLTIYQLEEEKSSKISYLEIANYLNLSEGCIRTYISTLIKQGFPVNKTRINNKLVVLSINPEFRALNLKKDLIDLYYNTDTIHKTLNTYS